MKCFDFSKGSTIEGGEEYIERSEEMLKEVDLLNHLKYEWTL